MPTTFFHSSPYLRKYDLIRLTPYHWQPYNWQFSDITKEMTLQKFSQTTKQDYQLVAVSSQTKSEKLATATGTNRVYSVHCTHSLAVLICSAV